MPITPRFDVSQTSTSVIVTIHTALSIRISSETIQIVVEDASVLHVSAPPYLLRLSFAPRRFRTVKAPTEDAELVDEEVADVSVPKNEGTNPLISVISESNNFSEDEQDPDNSNTIIGEECEPQSVVWDPSDSTIVVTLLKDDDDEYWPNLDMVARLMVPSSRVAPKWLQSVVSQDGEETNGNEEDRLESKIEHEGGGDTGDRLLGDTNYYGFASMFCGLLGGDFRQAGLAQELLQMDNNIDPESSTAEERHELRMQRESDDFDADRYLGDHILSGIDDDYIYQCSMSYVAEWEKSVVCNSEGIEPGDDDSDRCLADRMQNQLSMNDGKNATSPSTSSFSFTSDERLRLATIPYPLLPFWCLEAHRGDDPRMRIIWNGLLDLLFAFLYDKVLTQDEPTVESAWTISTLSCSLSWLDEIKSMADDVVYSSLRRMLIYPYLRNWELGCKIWRHVVSLLRHVDARGHIIRCLLEMRAVLDRSESYYLCNKLYVDPYLAWIQRCDGTIPFGEMADDIDRVLSQPVDVLKDSLGLQLVKLEGLYFGPDDDEIDNKDEGSSAESSCELDSSCESDSDGSSDDAGTDDHYDDNDNDDDDDDDDEHGFPLDKDASSKSTTAELSMSYPTPSDALLDDQLGTESSILEVSNAVGSPTEGECRLKRTLIEEVKDP